MDIRQMKYFLAVAQEGQFTKAAERLRLAQPALSMQIKQMEKELGIQLFERQGRHLALTEGGSILLVRAEQILSLFDSATQELQDMNKGQNGILSIGSLASSDAHILQLLQKYIVNFHENYPDVTYQMLAGDTFRILELLDKGLIEIGIVRTPVDQKKYNCLINPDSLSPDPMVAVYNDLKWNLGGEKELFSVDHLKEFPLILHSRTRQKTIELCQSHGFSPKVFCVSDDICAMLAWANIGLGITLLTNSSVPASENQHIQIKEIHEQLLSSKTIVIWKNDHCLSAVARNFIENIRQIESLHADTIMNI